MIKGLWLVLLCVLFASCASNSNSVQNESSTTGTEMSALPKPNTATSIFSPYFSSIDSTILLNIQKGTPQSLQRAMASLRGTYDGSLEQADVLLAICTAILEYAWPSSTYTEINYAQVPSNVYTSTLESIERGIYENAFESGDFFSLTLPSLVLFSNVNLTDYYANALTSLEKSLALDSSSVLTLYLLGVLSMRMEEYAQAEQYFQRALQLDGKNKDIMYAYFNSLLKTGKNDEAIAFGNNAILTYPNDVTLLELSAMAAFNNLDYVSAESLIAQSLQFAPGNTSLLLFRAKVLFELGDYLDVSTLLDVYSRTSSQNKDYLLLRAKLQSAWNKNIPSAIKTIQEALALYANDLDVLLLAAELASSSGQRVLNKTALELLTQVLEKDPENLQALSILVHESISQQNWETAYEASSIILTQGNATFDAAVKHTEICIALGFIDEARSTIVPIYSVSSNNENLQQWYIRLLIAEANFTEASNVISQLLPSATGRMKSVLYFERSRLQGSDERILADLRASLTANPRNDFALFGLYTYYYDRNDYSKAQYYLKQVIALNPSNTDALERNAELDVLLQ